ncbi:hypothetical protein JOM56_006731 [Amanita muscaria]
MSSRLPVSSSDITESEECQRVHREGGCAQCGRGRIMWIIPEDRAEERLRSAASAAPSPECTEIETSFSSGRRRDSDSAKNCYTSRVFQEIAVRCNRYDNRGLRLLGFLNVQTLLAQCIGYRIVHVVMVYNRNNPNLLTERSRRHSAAHPISLPTILSVVLSWHWGYMYHYIARYNYISFLLTPKVTSVHSAFATNVANIAELHLQPTMLSYVLLAKQGGQEGNMSIARWGLVRSESVHLEEKNRIPVLRVVDISLPPSNYLMKYQEPSMPAGRMAPTILLTMEDQKLARARKIAKVKLLSRTH